MAHNMDLPESIQFLVRFFCIYGYYIACAPLFWSYVSETDEEGFGEGGVETPGV